MELNEILEALKNLSVDDKAKIQEALTPAAESLDDAQAADEQTDEAVTTAAEEVVEDIADDKAASADGEKPDYENTADDEKELVDAVKADETADKAVEAKTAEAAPVAEEPIPEMSRTAVAPDEAVAAAQAPPIQDEQGADLPVDYQQIIDGLNAKTLALEAENKQLKAKVEGAFGLTGKPGAFAAVNPLYSETSDIPRMRK